MLATNLVEKDLYLNKSISYLKNVKITEYDMKTAGFNIIRELKLLNQEKINELESITLFDNKFIEPIKYNENINTFVIHHNIKTHEDIYLNNI